MALVSNVATSAVHKLPHAHHGGTRAPASRLSYSTTTTCRSTPPGIMSADGVGGGMDDAAAWVVSFPRCLLGRPLTELGVLANGGELGAAAVHSGL